jgi:cell division protein FtsI (penicillin-binding protein 3)
MSDSQRDQVSFGQALSVTGIQEAASIAGLVNGGIYNPPKVLKRDYDADGRDVPIERRPPRRIISEQSSAQVRDVMAAVIDSENGQRNLSLEGYRTGGKTGTAQRADPKCRCYRGYVTSFVGFAPLDDPQLLTYVVITNPRKADTGTMTAGPVYTDVMSIALSRYSVPPGAKSRKPLATEW